MSKALSQAVELVDGTPIRCNSVTRGTPHSSQDRALGKALRSNAMHVDARLLADHEALAMAEQTPIFRGEQGIANGSMVWTLTASIPELTFYEEAFTSSTDFLVEVVYGEPVWGFASRGRRLELDSSCIKRSLAVNSTAVFPWRSDFIKSIGIRLIAKRRLMGVLPLPTEVSKTVVAQGHVFLPFHTRKPRSQNIEMTLQDKDDREVASINLFCELKPIEGELIRAGGTPLHRALLSCQHGSDTVTAVGCPLLPPAGLKTLDVSLGECVAQKSEDLSPGISGETTKPSIQNANCWYMDDI
mmetsp:Transcript_5375/g.12978  ORF Transcript_5375/g.12978 Transcript_5375/m.12978 type:complete len:300 (+) Transcript_5375:48-947(+)